MPPVLNPEFAIAGAGIIGLTLALELHRRGASVVLLDTARAGQGASSAAAGMLAADDPHNPPELHELSAFSIALYEPFLATLEQLSELPVPFQTHSTVQYLDDGRTRRLAEHSVDPRQLRAAAHTAVLKSGIPLYESCRHIDLTEEPAGIRLQPEHGPSVFAKQLIHASGAWFSGRPQVAPRKGQMLRVRIPSDFDLREVHRSAALYIVPRTQGPQAGSALIGATDEDAGFDTQTFPQDLELLRTRAAALLPQLADRAAAPQLEAWAGLRPATRDRLPVIGAIPETHRQWIAGGHYRNGILLAPATASVMADVLEGKQPPVSLTPFRPQRLS